MIFFGFGQMAPGHVFGMPIPEQFADGPNVNDWAMWPANNEGIPDAAPAAQVNPLDFDLNEPVIAIDLNGPDNMDIEEVDPVLQPEIPAQQ